MNGSQLYEEKYATGRVKNPGRFDLEGLYQPRIEDEGESGPINT